MPISRNREEKALHLKIMSGVAESVSDTPMVLKGGTALLIGYGLDRFSEDLDFDSSKKINLTHRLSKTLNKLVDEYEIREKKNTDTVQRYMVDYKKGDIRGQLKIETSLRENINESTVRKVHNINLYNPKILIDNKLKASIENDENTHRTVARDLYDLTFLAEKYGEHFNNDQVKKSKIHTADISQTESRYKEAWKDDPLLNKRDLAKTILRLDDAITHIEKTKNKKLDQEKER